MLRLVDMAKLGRPVRQEDWSDLGIATQRKLDQAIDDGRMEDAKQLSQYTIDESKGLHDLFCDWIWDLLTQVAKRSGEDAMFEVLKASQQTWMLKRAWKGFLRFTVEERVQLSAEMMRAHHSGPEQDGGFEITDEGDYYRLSCDPCGSGGRMRRGDPVDGTPSRLGAPYNFGTTQEAHDWCWGKKDVPFYCVHCAVNEMVPMELGGHPLWVTDYHPDPAKPCGWRFYKKAEDIPEHYYTRLGRQKPAAGEGQY